SSATRWSISPTASSRSFTACSNAPARWSVASGCFPRSGAITSIPTRTSSTSASAASARSSGPILRSRPSVMPATAWLRRRAVELGWFAFAVANLLAMIRWERWETIPFHFIWVSLTLVYGFRVWRLGATALTLGFVIVSTGALITIDISRGTQVWGELFEVPLMSAMFMAMVWHARRRQDALGIAERHAEQLRIALDALLENAVKYSEPGDRIELSSRATGSMVVIEVDDEGIGVPDEPLARIFERFARSGPARTRTAGGVGLGLAIVDTIVKAHGGRSLVRRKPQGSVFGIQLPGFMSAWPSLQSAVARTAGATLK